MLFEIFQALEEEMKQLPVVCVCLCVQKSKKLYHSVYNWNNKV